MSRFSNSNNSIKNMTVDLAMLRLLVVFLSPLFPISAIAQEATTPFFKAMAPIYCFAIYGTHVIITSEGAYYVSEPGDYASSRHSAPETIPLNPKRLSLDGLRTRLEQISDVKVASDVESNPLFPFLEPYLFISAAVANEALNEQSPAEIDHMYRVDAISMLSRFPQNAISGTRWSPPIMYLGSLDIVWLNSDGGMLTVLYKNWYGYNLGISWGDRQTPKELRSLLEARNKVNINLAQERIFFKLFQDAPSWPLMSSFMNMLEMIAGRRMCDVSELSTMRKNAFYMVADVRRDFDGNVSALVFREPERSEGDRP